MIATPMPKSHSDLQPLRTGEEAIRLAKGLLPLLRNNAAQSERDRCLTHESSQAMREAGLYQLMAPRRVGGYEADIHTYVETCLELSKGDSAAGWVSMVMNGNALLMGLFPDATRHEVFGHDPLAAISGQWAPSAKTRIVKGGYEVTGKWMWASGCYQAQWNVVGFPVVGDDGEDLGVRLGLVPASELTIEDTWYVAGMSGTGSNTFVANDVFIPQHRTLLLSDVLNGHSLSDHHDEPLYRTPMISAVPLGISGAIIGMAEAAWEMTLANLAKGRGITGSIYTDARQSPSYQLNLADARAAIDSARLHTFRAADDIDRSIHQNERLDELSRARIRLDEATAIKRCREAMDLLLNINGASSFASANALQRIWRDIEVASRHGYINGDLGREIYGRALLGLEQVGGPF